MYEFGKVLAVLALIVMAFAPITSYKKMKQAQKERLKYDKIVINGKAYHPEGVSEIEFEVILVIYLILFAILGTALLTSEV